MADTNTRQGKRTPVTLKIKFKSETIEQFIERYAVDVSQGGIFIRTKEPLAVGTQMKFEFQLRDASPLIAGEGTVVWTRENDPSRPAIAPGMGVRFDRLAEGSQSVLERILAEKAKQAPSRNNSTTAENKAAMFTDTPTRVAPAPVQEALGVGRGGRNRADSEQTPLPRPMPFHSDAEDFDERAFEEATKVRSLDELAAASLEGHDMSEDAATATKIMPADELATRRREGSRADSTISDPPLAGPPPDRGGPIGRSIPDRDSAPGLPSPPPVEPARPRMDPTPPRPSEPPPKRPTSPGLAVPGDGMGSRTHLGLEPNKAQTSSPRMQVPPDAAIPRAVGPEPSRPAAPARPSSAPIVIGILFVVAAGIGAVWWFALREDVANKVADNTGSGSAVMTNSVGSGSAVAMAGSGSAGSAMAGSDAAHAGSGSAGMGSGSAGTMAAGSGAGSAVVAPAGPTVDTLIAAGTAKGATVEIVGLGMQGPAPFTAKLEKGKAYKARVSAPGFIASEIDVKGGERATAKLALEPRVVTVTTEPAGAAIYVDNVDTGKLTPSDVELTPAQAARPRVRVSMRRPGFRPLDQVVEATAFTDSSGGKMTTSIAGKLLVQQQVVRPPPTGGTTGGTGSGSATPAGTGTGSATAPTGTGTGSATTTTGTGSGSGAGAGSATKPLSGTGTTPATGTGTGSGSAAKPLSGTGTSTGTAGSGAAPPSTTL